MIKIFKCIEIPSQQMHPIFQDSEIRDLFLTPDIRYLEFNHIAEFKTVLKNLKKAGTDILYFGVHRIEEGKWIIVFFESEE